MLPNITAKQAKGEKYVGSNVFGIDHRGRRFIDYWNGNTHVQCQAVTEGGVMTTLEVKITFPEGYGIPTSDGIIRSYETEYTQKELKEVIRVYSKPSMFGMIGFTIEVLPAGRR